MEAPDTAQIGSRRPRTGRVDGDGLARTYPPLTRVLVASSAIGLTIRDSICSGHSLTLTNKPA
uniref:Uncharacterized protein n=1 Tax=Oryza punctata TaxID=4537 RepID=A0A0E0LTJ0_ORYPU